MSSFHGSRASRGERAHQPLMPETAPSESARFRPRAEGVRLVAPQAGEHPTHRGNRDTLSNRQRAQRADRPEQEDRAGDQERDGERGCVDLAARPALPESFDVLFASRLRFEAPQIAAGYDATGRWLARRPPTDVWDSARLTKSQIRAKERQTASMAAAQRLAGAVDLQAFRAGAAPAATP
jgi:hypothetical protein